MTRFYMNNRFCTALIVPAILLVVGFGPFSPFVDLASSPADAQDEAADESSEGGWSVLDMTSKTGVSFQIPSDYAPNDTWRAEAAIEGMSIHIAVKAKDEHTGRIAYMSMNKKGFHFQRNIAKLTGQGWEECKSTDKTVGSYTGQYAEVEYKDVAIPTKLYVVMVQTDLATHVWLMAASLEQYDWFKANIFEPMISSIKIGDVDYGVTKPSVDEGQKSLPFTQILKRSTERISNMGIVNPAIDEYGAGWPMVIFLLGVFLLCVGFLFNEGMWGAAIMFVNVVFAGLIAVNFYEPLAKSMDGAMPAAAAFTDFIALWAVFGIAITVLRIITDRVSKVKVRFLKIVDRIGGWSFAVLAGLVVMGFAGMSLHMAPVGFNGFGGGYLSSEDKTDRPQFLFVSPDEFWLGFARHTSRGTFSRMASEEEYNAGVYFFDPYVMKATGQGQWEGRYTLQRYMYDAYVRQGESLGMRERKDN